MKLLLGVVVLVPRLRTTPVLTGVLRPLLLAFEVVVAKEVSIFCYHTGKKH